MAYNLANSKWVQEQANEQGALVFNAKVVLEAEKYGIKFGTGEFLIYQYMRWCETNPQAKYPIMVAGYEHIMERFGFDKVEDVRTALNEMMKKGAVQHIICDERIYRGKTKVWISAEKCKKFVGKPTKFVGQPTNSAPVPPQSESNSKSIRSNIVSTLQVSKNNIRNACALKSENGDATHTQLSPQATIEGVIPSIKENEVDGTNSSDSHSTPRGRTVVKNTTMTPVNDPFNVDVDLKKSVKKSNADNASAAILGKRLLEIAGKSNKNVGGQLVKAIVRARKLGYSERELVMAVQRGMKLDYYVENGIFAMLSEVGLDHLLNDKWYKKEVDKKSYSLGGLMY